MASRRTVVLIAALAGLVALLIGAAGWWWFSAPDEPVATAPAPVKLTGWQSGELGYQKVQQHLKSHPSPVLYLIERNPGHCWRCKQLHDILFNHPEMQGELAPFVKVVLNPDQNNQSESAIRKLPPIISYPALYLQNAVGGPVIPLRIVVEAKQIWVPRDAYTKGNFMPLSAASLGMAIENSSKLLAEGKAPDPAKSQQ
ncbi:MAG: hypothetical protein ACRC8D_00375 [Aeromonas sp.]